MSLKKHKCKKVHEEKQNKNGCLSLMMASAMFEKYKGIKSLKLLRVDLESTCNINTLCNRK